MVAGAPGGAVPRAGAGLTPADSGGRGCPWSRCAGGGQGRPVPPAIGMRAGRPADSAAYGPRLTGRPPGRRGADRGV